MTRYTRMTMVAVLAALLVAAGAGSLHAEEMEFVAEYSGPVFRTASDIVDDTGDGSGARALASDLDQKGTFGQSTVHVLAETTSQPTGVFTPRCQFPYFVEFTYLAHTSVTRLASGGDMLYTVMDNGHTCVDPSTGQFIFAVDVFVAGGTGRFEGATGSGSTSGSGTILAFESSGLLAHAALEGISNLTIVTPDED